MVKYLLYTRILQLIKFRMKFVPLYNIIQKKKKKMTSAMWFSTLRNVTHRLD